MLFFVYILLLIWFISVLVDYNFFCYYWQLKEYRLDRFRDFCNSLQGKKILKIIIAQIIFAIIFIVFASVYANIVFKMILASLFILFPIIVRSHRLKFLRPALTAKSISIVALAIIVEILLFFLFKNIWPVFFVIIAFRLIIISLVILTLKIPNNLLRSYFYKKAANKLSKYKDLKVIGITGSYGKTTTKEFLFQILESKYKVIKTPEHVNTEIGIAKFIFKKDFTETEVFIVEMGAYRMNEIKNICDIVKPQIGVLTAINEAHLALFGDIKNTQKTKYELLEALPENGIAIVNADNKYCVENLDQLDCHVMTFGQVNKNEPTILINDLKSDKNQISFNLVLEQDQELNITASVISEHNAMNIAPCVLVAKDMGLTNDEIIVQCNDLKLENNYLEIIKYGQSIFINDSYNSNPQGFKSVLRLFEKYPEYEKKIIITRGMLELGIKSFEIHKRMGKRIAQSADELIVISDDAYRAFKSGVELVDTKIKVTKKIKPYELLNYVKSLKNIQAIVILENRIPAIVMKEIKKDAD